MLLTNFCFILSHYLNPIHLSLNLLTTVIMAKKERKDVGRSEDKELDHMRHSCSHVLAQAVLQMFPEAKLGIGPTTENGFYYDFDLPRTLIPEDLAILEEKMIKIVNEKQTFKRVDSTIKEALEFYKKADQKYKVDVVEGLLAQGEKEITFYENLNSEGKVAFSDLCRGGHSEDTGKTGAFKLTHFAGAYWRGDEKQPMLQRIYGVCFKDKKALRVYLDMMEEAKKRDHRKLGVELELFTFDDEVGAGLPLWLPNGAILRNEVMNFAFNTYLRRGYDPVSTPHIAHSSLWSHSGHLDFYSENMYGPLTIDEEEYRIKPMNCPFHVKMYKSNIRSYRDLPIRWTEMGTVYRYERSGVLHGLTRVRSFTQDDAHIICTPEQLKEEVEKALEITEYILGTFGFENYEVNVSIRDPENKNKFIGDDKLWDLAEQTLKDVLEKSGSFKNYIYDVGGAVFYGPKIDIKIADSIGRKWQLSTIQFDFNLPERFGMRYVGEDGKEHTPYMIHRAILGSLERFIGVLIEHYAGAFPTWLAPVQVKILPISDKFLDYARALADDLKEDNIRVKVDESNEGLGKKIRNAEMQKTPYMLVVGEKEVENKEVAVRGHKSKTQKVMSGAQFKSKLLEEIKQRLLVKSVVD